MFVLGKSKIEGAGNGVFVSNHYESIPVGTIIPYPGTISETKSNHGRNRNYQVALPKERFLISSNGYISGQPLGNFINRIMGRDDWKAFLAKLESTGQPKPSQNLTVLNARLTRMKDLAYIRVIKNIKAGDEVLIPYGSSFKV